MKPITIAPLQKLVQQKGQEVVENASLLLQRMMRAYTVRVQYSKMLREQMMKEQESMLEENRRKVEEEFKKDEQDHSLTLGYDSNPGQSMLVGEGDIRDIRYYSETPQTTRQEVTAQFLSNQQKSFSSHQKFSSSKNSSGKQPLSFHFQKVQHLKGSFNYPLSGDFSALQILNPPSPVEDNKNSFSPIFTASPPVQDKGPRKAIHSIPQLGSLTGKNKQAHLLPGRMLNFTPKSQRLMQPRFFQFDVFICAAKEIQRVFRGYLVRSRQINFYSVRQKVILFQRRFRKYRLEKHVKVMVRQLVQFIVLYQIFKSPAQENKPSLEKLEQRRPRPQFLKAVYKISQLIKRDVDQSAFLRSDHYSFPRKSSQENSPNRGRQMPKGKYQRRMYGYNSSSRSPDCSSLRGYSSERDTDTTRDYTTKQREKSNSKEKKRQQLPIKEGEKKKLKHRVLDLPKQMISHKYTPMSVEEKQKVKKLFIRKSNDPGNRKHSPQLTGRNMMMANLSQEVAKLKLQQEEFKKQRELSQKKKDKTGSQKIRGGVQNKESMGLKGSGGRSEDVGSLLKGIHSLKARLARQQEQNIEGIQTIMNSFREERVRALGEEEQTGRKI